MIYIYRERASNSARELAEGITILGVLARRTRGQALRNLTAADRVVCWGSNFAAAAGTKALNNVAPISKFAEAQLLKEKGVPTIEVSRQRPAGRAAAPAPAPPARFVPRNQVVGVGSYTVDNIGALIRQLTDFQNAEAARRTAWERQPAPVAAPAAPAETWLPRKNNHVGGFDLLTDRLADADYYSKKVDIVEEYRLHMFKGKSIRAGKKVAREFRPDGRTPAHAWIRSFDAGWIIQYDGFESVKAMRDVAAKAVEALGLDFGAVDVAKLRNGTYIVLEVNRAPGAEGGTVTAYAKKIIGWSRE